MPRSMEANDGLASPTTSVAVSKVREKGIVLTFRRPDGENAHQQCGDKLLDQERIDTRVHKRDRAAAVVSGLHLFLSEGRLR